MRVRAPILALAVLVAGCAHAPRDLVERGDRLLGGGDAPGARAAYAEALRDSKLSGLLLARAQVGEARALLAQGELRTAESRLSQVSDQVSAKWYVLGQVALGRGDPPEAESCFARALSRGHGGDTARVLARLIAGEATTPERWVAAQEVLAQGGEAEVGATLAEAEAVWRDLLAGADPAALLTRLEPAAAELPDLASVQLLRARLLQRCGRDEAAEAWTLAGVDPAPSAEFRAHADRLRARLAARSRDEDDLLALLGQAEPQVAGQLAASLAAARARRGDLTGAIRLLEAAARRDGPAGELALVRAAELEAWLGDPRAAAAWERLPRSPREPPELVARVARHEARARGLESGLRLLELGDLDGRAPSWPDPLSTAGRLAVAAADALVAGARADARADAAALLWPGAPLLEALSAAARADALDARLEHLDRAHPLARDAAQRLLLAAGRLDDARACGPPGPELTLADVRRAVRAALAADRGGEVGELLAWAGLDAESRATLEADAALSPLGAPPPTGRIAALPPGTHTGTLLLPTRRLRGVTLSIGATCTLQGPSGSLTAPDVDALAARLGVDPADARWTAEPSRAPAPTPFRAATVWEVE